MVQIVARIYQFWFQCGPQAKKSWPPLKSSDKMLVPLFCFQVKEGVSEYLEDGAYLRVRIQWEQNFQVSIFQTWQRPKKLVRFIIKIFSMRFYEMV